MTLVAIIVLNICVSFGVMAICARLIDIADAIRASKGEKE